MKKRLALIVLLLASTFFGLVATIALPRIAQAYEYAELLQFDEEGTGLSLTLHGDVAAFEQVLEFFQYFTVENMEWKGHLAAPDVSPDIWVKFGSLYFENKHLFATDMLIEISAGGVAFVHVDADETSADIEFWTTENELSAVNITATLTDVEFGLSIAVLPIPGLRQALYEYNGPQFIISICLIEQLQLSIESPIDGETVTGVELMQASVVVPEGISVERVMWRIERFDDREVHLWWEDLSYNDGVWEGEWISSDSPDGKYLLVFRVETVEDNSGMRNACEDRVHVEVKNEEWRVGEQINIRSETKHMTLHADKAYYIAHGWAQDNWFDIPPEERERWLNENRFELYINGKPVRLTEWVHYYKWDFMGKPEDKDMHWDVKQKFYYVHFEPNHFKVGKTYTFKGVWLFPADKENQEGRWEVEIEVTFI